MREPVRRACVLVALVFAANPASGAPRPAESPHVLPSQLVLTLYAAALAALAQPKVVSFDYTVEQLGLRNLEQAHRVYRSGLHERDETVFVDGYTLTRPAIRIFNDRTYRYDIASVAPTAGRYGFVFAGAVRQNAGYGYVFRTAPRDRGPFAVSEVQIDGRTFLPSIVRFKIAGTGARGTGELRYGPSEKYWVVREARVNARVTGGVSAHERIVWTNYRFPIALPPSTFEAPRPAPTKVPTAAF